MASRLAPNALRAAAYLAVLATVALAVAAPAAAHNGACECPPERSSSLDVQCMIGGLVVKCAYGYVLGDLHTT